MSKSNLHKAASLHEIDDRAARERWRKPKPAEQNLRHSFGTDNFVVSGFVHVANPCSAMKNQQLKCLIILGWKAAGLATKAGG
jgi:hypothetical protein